MSKEYYVKKITQCHDCLYNTCDKGIEKLLEDNDYGFTIYTKYGKNCYFEFDKKPIYKNRGFEFHDTTFIDNENLRLIYEYEWKDTPKIRENVEEVPFKERFPELFNILSTLPSYDNTTEFRLPTREEMHKGYVNRINENNNE